MQAALCPWLYPHQHTANCQSMDEATWLQITDVPQNSDTRPFANEITGPTWGYHFEDINLALENLVSDVRAAEATYKARS